MNLLDHEDILPFEMKLLATDGVSLGHFSDNVNNNPILAKASGKSLEPSQRMFVQNVKIVAQDRNANLKALAYAILKIVYEKQNNSELLEQIKCTLYSNDADLHQILKKPKRDLSNLIMKKILVQFFQLLRYGNYENKVQNKMLKYPIVLQLFVLFFRSILKSLSVECAENFQQKVSTKKSIPLLCQYFDISCRVFDNIFLFFQDGLFISTHDDQQFCVGEFYQRKRQTNVQQNQLEGLQEEDSESEEMNFGRSIVRNKASHNRNLLSKEQRSSSSSNSPQSHNRKLSDVASSQRQTPSFPDFSQEQVKIERRKKSFGGEVLTYQRLNKLTNSSAFQEQQKKQETKSLWGVKNVQSQSQHSSNKLQRQEYSISQDKIGQLTNQFEDQGMQTPDFNVTTNLIKPCNKKQRKYTFQQSPVVFQQTQDTPSFNNNFFEIQPRNKEKPQAQKPRTITQAEQKLEQSVAHQLQNANYRMIESNKNTFEQNKPLQNEQAQDNIFAQKAGIQKINSFKGAKNATEYQIEQGHLVYMKDKKQEKQKKWYPFSFNVSSKILRAKTDEDQILKNQTFISNKNSQIINKQFRSQNQSKQDDLSHLNCGQKQHRNNKKQLQSKIFEVTCFPNFKKKQESVSALGLYAQQYKQSVKNRNTCNILAGRKQQNAINQIPNIDFVKKSIINQHLNQNKQAHEKSSNSLTPQSSNLTFQHQIISSNRQMNRTSIQGHTVDMNFINRGLQYTQNSQISKSGKKYGNCQPYLKSQYTLPFQNTQKTQQYQSMHTPYPRLVQQTQYDPQKNNFTNKYISQTRSPVRNSNKTMPVNFGMRQFHPQNIKKSYIFTASTTNSQNYKSINGNQIPLKYFATTYSDLQKDANKFSNASAMQQSALITPDGYHYYKNK